MNGKDELYVDELLARIKELEAAYDAFHNMPFALVSGTIYIDQVAFETLIDAMDSVGEPD